MWIVIFFFWSIEGSIGQHTKYNIGVDVKHKTFKSDE